MHTPAARCGDLWGGGKTGPDNFISRWGSWKNRHTGAMLVFHWVHLPCLQDGVLAVLVAAVVCLCRLKCMI